MKVHSIQLCVVTMLVFVAMVVAIPPSDSPTFSPTILIQSADPTMLPTISPTSTTTSPSIAPTDMPSLETTTTPTISPTYFPSLLPSKSNEPTAYATDTSALQIVFYAFAAIGISSGLLLIAHSVYERHHAPVRHSVEETLPLLGSNSNL